MKKLLPLIGLTLAIGLSPALALKAEAADKIIKLAHLNKNDPFDNATGAMATVFKSLVESGTNGAIKVDIFPDGQLGKDNEVLQQVKAGVIQSSISSTGGIGSVYPQIGAIDIPFAFPNISATYAVFDGPFGKQLGDDIAKKTGMAVLGFGDSGGFFSFTNAKKPIKSPKDMAGLKIRTMPLESHKTVVSAMGGQPVTVAWAEVYTALQTGVVDGQMNPVPIIAFARFDEVQKYMTLTNHLFTPYVWVMNKAFLDGLTPEQQGIVKTAAKSAIVAGRGISRIIEASDRGLPALSAKMEVYAPTPAEMKAFRDVAQPAVLAFVEKTYGADGKAMSEAFLKAIDDAGK